MTSSGPTSTIAGFGTGFEVRLLALISEDLLGEGNNNGAGSMDVLDAFGQGVSLGPSVRAGAARRSPGLRCDPSGEHPPGPDLNQIHVTLFSDLKG